MGELVEQESQTADIAQVERLKGLGGFVGEYRHTMDLKRRLTIPSVWRTQMGDSNVYVMPDSDHKCLNLYPAREILPKIERLRQTSMFDEKARDAVRRLGRSSELLTCDEKQGRIRISDRLLAFAGLSGEVVMVGAFDRIELWNPTDARALWNDTEDGIDQKALKDLRQYM